MHHPAGVQRVCRSGIARAGRGGWGKTAPLGLHDIERREETGPSLRHLLFHRVRKGGVHVPRDDRNRRRAVVVYDDPKDRLDDAAVATILKHGSITISKG